MRIKFVTTIFVFLLTCIYLTSCVKKSEYEAVCDDKLKLEQEVQDYQHLISQKDKQIADLQYQLDNSQSSSSSNENKGKTELEYVKSTLGELVSKMNNCQTQDDLDLIIKKSKDLNSHVDSFLFFNY